MKKVVNAASSAFKTRIRYSREIKLAFCVELEKIRTQELSPSYVWPYTHCSLTYCLKNMTKSDNQRGPLFSRLQIHKGDPYYSRQARPGGASPDS